MSAPITVARSALRAVRTSIAARASAVAYTHTHTLSHTHASTHAFGRPYAGFVSVNARCMSSIPATVVGSLASARGAGAATGASRDIGVCRAPANSPTHTHAHSHTHARSPTHTRLRTLYRAFSTSASDDEPADFASLGIHKDIIDRLAALGIHKPTEPQIKAIPAILAGFDVTLRAETGSGKTLAYVLPLTHVLTHVLTHRLTQGQAHRQTQGQTQGQTHGRTHGRARADVISHARTSSHAGGAAAGDGSVESAGEDEMDDDMGVAEDGARGGKPAAGRHSASVLDPRVSAHALVLVPTQELAEQVAAVARALLPPQLASRVRAVYGNKGIARREDVDVVIGTPAAVHAHVNFRHMRGIQMLVLDEADLLLSGTYTQAVKGHVLATFKQQAAEHRPQHVFVAATLSNVGKDAPRKFIEKYYGGDTMHFIETTGSHKILKTINQRFVQVDAELPLTKAEIEAKERRATKSKVPVSPRMLLEATPTDADSDDDDDVALQMQRRAAEDHALELREDEAEYMKRLEALRGHALLSVLAPVHAHSAKAREDNVSDVASEFARTELALSSSRKGHGTRRAAQREAVVPDKSAQAVSPIGESTIADPESKPTFEQLVRPVSLRRAITPEEAAHVPRTLVFVNSTEAAEDVRKLIASAAGDAFRVAALHKRVTDEVRAQRVSGFANGDIRVLVSTDVAARGLDTIWVEHVIQAEFATDAVSFLHRAGRTARAGRHGRMTSLITRTNLDLAQAVLHALEKDQPVDAVFSARRSLRKRVKKAEAAVPVVAERDM